MARKVLVIDTGHQAFDELDAADVPDLSADYEAAGAAAAAQAAAESYADGLVTGLLDFKGATNASGNPNYPAALKGDAYVVSVAGKIGGASGVSVEVGDVYVASADNAGGTQAGVGASWFLLEHNVVGALLAANNLSDLANAGTARTSLGLGTAAVAATGDFDAAGAAAAAQSAAASDATTKANAAQAAAIAASLGATAAAGGDLAGNYPNPTVVDDSHSHTGSTLPGLAPTGADYLVGTAQGGLSAEIVVGTSPGGELGGTWDTPTVDATHSGSSHAGVVSAHEAAGDPHPGYLTSAEGNAAYDAIGAAAAAQAASQPLDSDLTALAGLAIAADKLPYGTGSHTLGLADFTAAGRALVDDADAAAQRTTLGLGTAATQASGAFDAAGAAAAAQSASQPVDSDLTAIAAIAPANDDVIQRKAGAWTNRTLAQLIADLAALGTTFQPLDADLTAIAALVTTAFGRSILAAADPADATKYWDGSGAFSVPAGSGLSHPQVLARTLGA